MMLMEISSINTIYYTTYNEKDIVIGKGLVEAVKLEEEANLSNNYIGRKGTKRIF